MPPFRILIGGDTCPIGKNSILFENGDRHALLGEFEQLFTSADFRILNLECPLVTDLTPTSKIGPNLSAFTKSVKGLKALDVDLALLANNHILDHGIAGYESTVRVLEESGISHVGAGENLQHAQKPFFHQQGEHKPGILAVAASEFNIATETTPGACPLDLIDLSQSIEQALEQCTYLIIFVHAGPGGFPFPTPRLKKIAHFLCDKGASAVIFQHSHITGCYENYSTKNGRTCHIVYGQGNLFFDLGQKYATEWHRGILIELCFDDCPKTPVIQFHSYQQSIPQPGLQSIPEQSQSWLAEFKNRSAQSLDDEFIKRQFAKYVQQKKETYLGMLVSTNKWYLRLSRRIPLAARILGSRRKQVLLNYVRCEDHQEVLQQLLSSDR